MRKRLLYLTLAVVVALSAFVIGSRFGSACVAAPSVASPAEQAASGQRGVPMDTGLFRNIAKRENPMVVFITTQSKVKVPTMDQFGGDDFFNRFFGIPSEPREEIQRAVGSGFIIGTDGEVLTNNHVVQGAEQIKVGLFGSDRKTYDATIVGRDPLSDTALIKLQKPPANLQVATLGDSDALEPGDWVMAIGNPFQLGHTVTVGVISYKGRPFTIAEGRQQSMLQTDAAINPGNSGGPLVNASGQVIGINSAILAGADGAGNIGIGFAVPINTVKALLPQLRKGKVIRGRIGVSVRSAPLNETEAKQLGLPKAEGALVAQVERDSPASRAGIKPGDVIVDFNGKPVTDADELTRMVTGTAPGTRAPVRVYRDGKELTLTVTVEELQIEAEGQAGGASAAAGFGLMLGDLTPDLAQQLGVPVGVSGAVVESVRPGSPASDAGVQRGDLIMEINRRPVRGGQAAARALQNVQPGQTVFLLISRGGQEVFLTMQK
jgi:serine protease Do